VLADVEPLAEVIGRPPEPRLVRGEEPGVVALLELGQGLFANLLQVVEIEADLVAFDRGAAGVTEIHGGVPFGFDGG